MLAIVNFFIRPIMVLLTLPLTVITLGLFLLVINAIVLMLVGALVPGIQIRSFWGAFIGSILLALLNFGVAAILGSSA